MGMSTNLSEKLPRGRSAAARANGGVKPLPKLNLVRGAVDRLREQILSGHIAADEPMPPEEQLCQQLGVSRTVIREAMRVLQSQGLVEVSQGKRSRVKPADPQDVAQTLGTFLQRGKHSLLMLVEVRRPLESEAAALAAAQAEPEEVAALDGAVERMAVARSLAAVVEADMAFHSLLATATHNPVFPLLWGVLADLLRRARRRPITKPRLERTVSGHRGCTAGCQRPAARTCPQGHDRAPGVCRTRLARVGRAILMPCSTRCAAAYLLFRRT